MFDCYCFITGDSTLYLLNAQHLINNAETEKTNSQNLQWTNKNNTMITKIEHPNLVLIDALIFAKFSLSLVYQWCFFRLYIFISFLFFHQRHGPAFFFVFSSLHFCCLFSIFKLQIHITLFWSFLALSLPSNHRFSLDNSFF